MAEYVPCTDEARVRFPVGPFLESNFDSEQVHGGQIIFTNYRVSLEAGESIFPTTKSFLKISYIKIKLIIFKNSPSEYFFIKESEKYK